MPTDTNEAMPLDLERLRARATKAKRDVGEHGRISLTPDEMLALLDRIAELEAERHTLRIVGEQMSNVMFNLSQESGQQVTDRIKASMRRLYKEWDAARQQGGAHGTGAGSRIPAGKGE